MEPIFSDTDSTAGIDRVDGRMKVTGAAKFSAEYKPANMVYGIVVTSTITKGKITALDTKKAEKAPGVLGVISHLNAPDIPGYKKGSNPAKGPTLGQPLRVFHDATVYFNGQPIALVVADTLERAVYAATLVKAQYSKQEFSTDLDKDKSKAEAASQGKPTYLRGQADVYKSAAVSVDNEYTLAREVHNPMELHSIVAMWDGDDKVKVYEKTQGVKSTQESIMSAFDLQEKNVEVISKYVGGGFGSALRTWPHSIAAVIGAKVIKRPLKLMLSRDQMFTMVGYRPYTWQRVALGATNDGKLVSIAHDAVGETSKYEEFTEGVVNMSRFMYDCPNVQTSYKILPLDVSTPTWMRGPGEATGAWALESALDELSYKLNMDPLELRMRNYAETDPERNIPFSSKFLKECYEVGAEKIGWNKRDRGVRSMKDGEWLVGYGVSSGTFGAYRDKATVKAKLSADGTLVLECGVSDSGPGTATSMTELASKTLGLSPDKITFVLGDSKLPEGPTQGGSTTTSSLGSAVYEVCGALKLKLVTLAAQPSSPFAGLRPEGVAFSRGEMSLMSDASTKISYADVLKQNQLPAIEVTLSSEPGKQSQPFSMHSFSVHFVEVRVHPLTGVVRVHRAVAVSDAGKIISPKAAQSQAIGGVVGGIGMALTEEAVIDHRYGRYVNNNFADYHVPVHADVPHIEAIFINKPDPYTNPMGSKGLGEIALIGFAAAVANAVYHATGKRIRSLPITPDKVLA